jgi:hypothetical protein
MNSGKVQLDVIIKGKDEVAAMLANIEKQAKQTEKQLKSVSDSDLKPDINGLSAVRDTLGNTVEAVDKAEERFNKLVGALGFVGAAFAIVPVIYEFAKELFNAETASDRARQSVGRLSDILIQAKKDFHEFNKERAATEGLRLALEIEDKIVAATEAGAAVAHERIELESQLAQILEEQTKNDYQARLSSLQAFVKENEKELGYTRDVMYAKVQINHLDVYRAREQKEINFLQDRLNEAKSAEQRYAEEILNLEQDKTDALKSQLRELKEITKESKILYFLSGGVFGAAPEKKRKPLGGPRRKTPAEIGEERTKERIDSDARTIEAMARLDKSLAEQEASRAKLQAELSLLEDMQENQALLEEEIRLFDEYTDSIYKAADAFDTLSEALGASLDLFPEIGDGFRGVQEAMQRHASFVKANEEQVAQGFLTSAEAVAAGEESKTKAIISGSTEGLAAIGKLVGGLKAEYALRAAGELAMGFATLANPVESAGHFVAAGLFAVAAGKAASGGGGKGASAAGGDGEAPASSSSLGYGDGGGGQRTVVYNFSTLIADRQQVHRAIRDSELVGARNGYGRRRGV